MTHRGGLKPLMSTELICESQPDAGADRACWNPAVPGPMRRDLYESYTDWNPERPCGNEACWRHGVPIRRLTATRLQRRRQAVTSLIALHQRLHGGL
jgi:hypothetical protein